MIRRDVVQVERIDLLTCCRVDVCRIGRCSELGGHTLHRLMHLIKFVCLWITGCKNLHGVCNIKV